MMAGNPNWRSMHPHPHFVFGTSNSNPSPPSDLHHDLPVRSWSHLLLGGLRGNEEESLFQQQKKLEDEELNLNPSFSTIYVDVKQESIYGQLVDDQFQNQVSKSHHHPQSLFNFSSKDSKNHHHIQDHSSQGTRWERKNGGVTKKAKVQQSAQPALKVRKEKLGDRITALHQLVSPFGKTDTASVLSEAIGYIRFLQCQVETLSSSYMRNGAENTIHQQHSVNKYPYTCQFSYTISHARPRFLPSSPSPPHYKINYLPRNGWPSGGVGKTRIERSQIRIPPTPLGLSLLHRVFPV